MYWNKITFEWLPHFTTSTLHHWAHHLPSTLLLPIMHHFSSCLPKLRIHVFNSRNQRTEVTQQPGCNPSTDDSIHLGGSLCHASCIVISFYKRVDTSQLPPRGPHSSSPATAGGPFRRGEWRWGDEVLQNHKDNPEQKLWKPAALSVLTLLQLYTSKLSWGVTWIFRSYLSPRVCQTLITHPFVANLPAKTALVTLYFYFSCNIQLMMREKERWYHVINKFTRKSTERWV